MRNDIMMCKKDFIILFLMFFMIDNIATTGITTANPIIWSNKHQNCYTKMENITTGYWES